jgi:hypothetical protein
MRAVIAPLSKATRSFRAQPPVRRELLLLLVMLLVAVLILPTLVWLAGHVFLGDYLRSPAGGTGGPLALTLDFVAGLFSGSVGYWLMLVGPYVLVAAWRVGARLLKM